MNLFKLVGSIMVDSSDADKSIQKTGKNAQGLGKTFVKGVGSAVKFGVGLAAGVGVGAAALLGLATKSAAAGDRIDKLSQKIGLSRKGFQEFDFIASQSGMSIEVLQSGFKKLSDTMVDANEGNKLASKAFDDLGVSAEDSTGKLKSQEQMFNETIVALQKMPEGAKKSSIANDLLGKSASELAPLINGAAGSVEEMRKKANDLGLVLSDETIDASVKFTDSMDQVKRSLSAVVTNVGASVMPMMQGLLEWVSNNMPAIKSTFKTAFDGISTVVKGSVDIFKSYLMPAFTNLYNWIQPNIPVIKQIMQDAFGLIKTAIQGVSDGIGIGIDWIKKYSDILIPLGLGIGAAALAFGIYTLAISAYTLATSIATGATGAFGTVMAFITSPIGIVILAIGALIGIFVLAYNNIEGFRNLIDVAWSFIQTKTKEIFEGYIMPFIRDTLMPLFQKVFSTIGDVVKGAFTLMGWAWNYVLKPVFMVLMFYIQNIMVPAWKLAFSIIGGAVKSVFSTIGNLWNNSLKPIFNGILDFISGVFTGNWKKAWGGIVGIFKGIWEGMKAIAKAPINFIIGGLNGFIAGINKIKIPDWVPKMGGMGINIPRIPSFAVGTDSLPYDMVIQAHKGEMITPSKDNPHSNEYTGDKSKDNNKQPITLQLLLGNGKAVAEFLIDDINKLVGNTNLVAGRNNGL